MKLYRLSPGLLSLLLILLAAAPAQAQENVIISEFMPANTRTLADEDLDFPDWIELFNGGQTTVNLAGWRLTDDPAAPAKWSFPSVTVPPGGFLVVFASGKNRTNNPARLHTNFQLDFGGGYLALFQPDGITAASAYQYAKVKDDVSFGLAQQAQTTSLLAASKPVVLVPASAAQLPAAWNQRGFNPDGLWLAGVAPPSIGFDTNQLTGLPSNVAPTGAAAESTVNASFTADLAINNNLTDFTHTLGTDPAPFWQVTLPAQKAIYSVLLLNRVGCCGSRLRDITLEILATNSTGTVTNFSSVLLNPENAGYSYPNGPVGLTNDLVALTGGPVFGQIVRVRRTPDPDLSGTGGQGNADEAAVISMSEVIVNASAASGLRPYFTTDIQSLVWNVNPSAFLRIPFVTAGAPDTLALRVRYDDGFVAWLNGVEIARRNAPAAPAWNSAATADRTLGAAIVAETIDLSSAIPSLLAGTNVLAVQVLNAGAGNPDLLLQPELIATGFTFTTNVFLVDATPGSLNNSAYYLDEVADTRFSVDRGFFDTPFSLSITSGTPDAVIYYSFNADEPGPAKGTLYTGPIPIAKTTVVRTRAFKSGWKPTDVDTATYLFLGDVILQATNWSRANPVPPQYFPATWGQNLVDYGMDPQVTTNYTAAQWREALTQIPTMSIVTEMPNLFNAAIGIYANASSHGEQWERPASIELLDPTNAVAGRFQENCGLRIRGGASRDPSFLKHSLRVFFRAQYGAGKLKYPLFDGDGAQEFDTFDLRTSQNYSWPRNDSSTHDTMVREVFCRKTLGDMGQPYRRSRYYHLYLNGQYWGLYETDERPEASYGETYFGGSKTNYDVVKCGNHIANFVTETTDGNFIAWSNLWTLCQSMRTNASDSTYFRTIGCDADGRRNPALPVLLDVDNLIDYMLEIIYSGDGDATLSSFLGNNQPNNWFGMRDRTNPNVGFRFFNSDCEHTLGSPNSQVDRTGPFGGSNEGNFTFSNPQWMHEELMRNAEYRQRFADHVQKHFFNGGALTFEASTNRFLSKATQINKAIRAYSARWGDPVTDGIGRVPYGENDWTNELAIILNTWFPPRASLVLNQLLADRLYSTVTAPAFSQLGGDVPAGYPLQMVQTNNGGVIFFTLDGSDPRQTGGAVGPSAIAYATALVINAPTLLRARTLVGTNWSGLLEFVFRPPQDLSRLAVTEIMYNPPAFGAVSGDELEFLELKNEGPTALNLGGLRFTAGIAYTFPLGAILQPGAFHLLVRNEVAFTNKYPGVRVNGIYTGKLDNGGETLTLSLPSGATVLSFSYSDTAPWPIASDNHGFSLVPRQPAVSADPDSPVHWGASSLVGGSPGRDDPPAPVAPVLINEVLSHSEIGGDWIELFNPNPTAVDLAGWFLTDDANIPMKFRIPEGIHIEPLSHLVFDEAQFNATPGTNNSFSLNGRGDGVFLFSGDAATNLTGFSHGFAFGAAADGTTFGRYVISTGEEQFPGQQATTRGLPNSGPSVGPVVISEIQYHPAADDAGFEFVEFRNITANAVPLFDPLHPTHPWRVNGLGFTFPTNVTLPPFGLLLVTRTNAGAFLSRHAVPAGVPLLTPYTGTLQDSGERLELQRPDAPDTNGFAYITVDEVRYNDHSPWPSAADGSGASLQRKNPSAYGNDPANWEAATPTPGEDFVNGQSPSIVTQPRNQLAFIGQGVQFTVVAAGPGLLRYQWRYNGDPIVGQTDSTLVLNSIQPSASGSYSVVIFNPAGSAASAPATLTVARLPSILQQPASLLVPPGSNATFTVSATGNGFLRYQWSFNGVRLPGQTNVALTVTNADLPNVGDYAVTVTDSVGSRASAPGTLLLRVNPVILEQPRSQVVVSGATVVLTVTITNTATQPVGYRIRRNNATQAGSGGVFTGTTAFFTITNAQPQYTNWAFVVTNAAQLGGLLTSNALLTFLPDLDGDGLPDSWESQYFGSATGADPRQDADGDGVSNGDEYTAGTDPKDPSSYLKLEPILSGVTLRFNAVSNRTYSVLFKTNMNSESWARLGDLGARLVTGPASLFDPSSNSAQRIYRLVTPRQP